MDIIYDIRKVNSLNVLENAKVGTLWFFRSLLAKDMMLIYRFFRVMTYLVGRLHITGFHRVKIALEQKRGGDQILVDGKIMKLILLEPVKQRGL